MALFSSCRLAGFDSRVRIHYQVPLTLSAFPLYFSEQGKGKLHWPSLRQASRTDNHLEMGVRVTRHSQLAITDLEMAPQTSRNWVATRRTMLPAPSRESSWLQLEGIGIRRVEGSPRKAALSSPHTPD
jgi:hypothetical protein